MQARAERHKLIRYFAVIDGESGYALDFYPAEREKYIQQMGDMIIGEGTRKEVEKIIRIALTKRAYP